MTEEFSRRSDFFLQDCFQNKSDTLPLTSDRIAKESRAVEELIDEIMQPLNLSSETNSCLQSRSPILHSEQKSKRKKLSIGPLWISIGFLASFFLGSIFGFFWGKTEKKEEASLHREEIGKNLFLNQEEINFLLDKARKEPPDNKEIPEEMLEPLEDSFDPFRNFAPSSLR